LKRRSEVAFLERLFDEAFGSGLSKRLFGEAF
jgi:hypothetical protein